MARLAIARGIAPPLRVCAPLDRAQGSYRGLGSGAPRLASAALSAFVVHAGRGVRARRIAMAAQTVEANAYLKSKVEEMIALQPIMVFSKSWCPFCKKAKDSLQQEGIRFGVCELDTLGEEVEAQVQDILAEITGARTVPRVFIGGQCIGGGTDTENMAADGSLKKLAGEAMQDFKTKIAGSGTFELDKKDEDFIALEDDNFGSYLCERLASPAMARLAIARGIAPPLRVCAPVERAQGSRRGLGSGARGAPPRLATAALSAFVQAGRGVRARRIAMAAQTAEDQKDHKDQRPKLAMTVMGATGDLAKVETFPALLDLFGHGMLEDAVIVGFARKDKTREEFHDIVSEALENSHVCKEMPELRDSIPGFLERVHYFKGSYDSDESMAELDSFLKEEEGKLREGPTLRLFYMAIPPFVFPGAAQAIRNKAMSDNTRLIVEKPFGHDLSSATELQEKLGAMFEEEAIYRMDHFLGYEINQSRSGLATSFWSPS
ncbi:unnamed protein product [Effrenium voratum]|nr:unnamed protein product [Effrenium voratum]